MSFTIGILYTGGTIGSVGHVLSPLSDGDFETAFDDTITPILKSQYDDLAVSFIPYGKSLDSTNLQPSDWCKMAAAILGDYDNCDAFIVLHGTDTMAYSASALSFLFTGLQPNGFPNAVLSKPVILTGSQVPLFYQKAKDEPAADLTIRFDTDAYQNVCGAVSAAYTGVPEVCLFFRNTLFRGNRTAKTNASEFDAFSSPNYPALGEAGIEFYLDNDNTLHLPTTQEISLDSPDAQAVLQHQLSYLTDHIDGAGVLPFLAYPAPYTESPAASALANVLAAALGTGIGGLVLESYGEGNFPSGNPDTPSDGAIYQVLAAAHAGGVVIVDNTQVLAGIVNSTAYASGSWLADAGAVGAFDMTPLASVAKLIYLLTLRHYGSNDWSQAHVEQLMQTNITGEIMDVNRLDTRGEWYLAPGEQIMALDGSATLTNDHALGPALRSASQPATDPPLWAPLGDSPDADMPGRLYMQGDGNLVFYDASNIARWASGTTPAGPATSMLILDPGPNLYIYNYAQGEVTAELYP